MKKIEHLSFSYDNAPVLSDFSAEFDDTGLYAVTGGSGAGKTTLLRIITGLEKNYTGKIAGFENDTFSVSFQTPRLLEWLTARENIAAVLSGSRKERLALADKWLDALDMSEHKFKHPSELSGGQRQRVSLARAFAKSSSVLIFDEPTTGLDSELTENVMNIIRAESEKRLVIFVTHGEKEKKFAKKVINL